MKYLVAGMLLAITMPVFAEGKATIATGGEQDPMQMIIRWAGDNMRMDFPEQQQGYLLLRDDAGFMVAKQGGQTILIDMSMLKGMADAMGDQAETISENQAESVESLDATSEKETIAGIEGEIYRIQWTDRSGNTHDDEMVLSDNPLALSMLRAFQRYVLTVMDEADPIGSAALERDLGMLRFNDKFQVIELAEDSPADDVFALPENATTMQEMLQQMGDADSQ